MERYQDAVDRIREILSEETVREPFRAYFKSAAEYVLRLDAFAGFSGREDIASTAHIAELKDYSRLLFADLTEGYDSSWLNPAFAYRQTGSYGPVLSALLLELRRAAVLVYERRMEEITAVLETFIQVYCLFEDSYLETDRRTGGKILPDVKTVRSVLYSYCYDDSELFTEREMQEKYLPLETCLKRVIETADFRNTDYLYRLGGYVSPELLETARFICSLPEEDIDRMAETWYRGFKEGFRLAGKPYDRKSVIEFRYTPGFERVVRKTAGCFRQDHYDYTVPRQPMHFLTGNPGRGQGFSLIANRQMEEDHAYDLSLVMGDRIVSRLLEERKQVFLSFGEEIRRYAGPVVMESFGEPAFEAEEKKEKLRFTEHQAACYGSFQNSMQLLVHEFILEEERSFTIISWPLPSVGAHFEEIFRETIGINTMDAGVYGPIQKKLCDALDEAEYVHVTGRGNGTDMTVYLHPLLHPERESNFENCLSDVNIPLGEVFTSPQLEGTHGVLHVRSVYIEGTRFTDLRLVFEDGRVTDYSCGNFADPEDGRALIRKVIFGEKEHLPLGEFAIGTNTRAYAAVRKYGIGAMMPILIAEKTGPHFAVGDTCYSFMEDMQLRNPDGKELTAKDNSVSLLRKTAPEQAYFAVHTDITIPYNELDSIVLTRRDGSSAAVIADGRFVLPGTEVLNAPLED